MYTTSLCSHVNTIYAKLVQLERQIQTHCLYPHSQTDSVQVNTPEYNAKRDICNTFDPDKSISIHLDPPSTERPPLVDIKQEGKNSIYTTDFYFTNKSPSNIVVPSPSQNNTTPTGDKAAAADSTTFDTDPLQPGQICLYSWMLYTLQAPILDLTGKDIKSTKDIEHAFHTLNLHPKENNEETPSGREETRGTNKFK